MAWNDDGNDLKNTILSTGSAAGSLLGQAIGLSPVIAGGAIAFNRIRSCLLYTSPSPRDRG